MFATSVPLPPTGPPPAFAGVAFFGVLFASGVGVAGGAGLRAVVRFFSGAGMSVGFVSARFGGVAGVGVGAGGSRVTAPIDRGPAGAAMRCTLYTGGSAFGADGRAMMAAEMSAACSTTEIPNGPPSRALLSRRNTLFLQRLRHEPDIANARLAHHREHANDTAVLRAFIGTKIDAVGASPTRERLE